MDFNVKYQLIGLLGVGGLGGVLAYYLRARVDLWRARSGAEVSTMQAPLNTLLQIIQNGEKAATELRNDMKLLITNHFAHDSQERIEFTKIITQQTEMLRQTCEMIREDRVSSAEQRKGIHERITQLAMKGPQGA